MMRISGWISGAGEAQRQRPSSPVQAARQYALEELGWETAIVAGTIKGGYGSSLVLLAVEPGRDLCLLVEQPPIGSGYEVTNECDPSDFYRNGGKRRHGKALADYPKPPREA